MAFFDVAGVRADVGPSLASILERPKAGVEVASFLVVVVVAGWGDAGIRLFGRSSYTLVGFLLTAEVIFFCKGET